MAQKGQKLDGLCYVAWDTSANAGKTGDVLNHTLRLVGDGLELIPSNSPFEVDSSGCPGLYKINLTATEVNFNIFTLAGKSSTSNVILVPVQITTTAAAALATVVQRQNNNLIWTDAQLEQWSEDAIGQIAVDVNCIFVRECIAVTQGQSVYTLPAYVRTVRRVTWRGRTLDAESWEELTMLTPATVFLSQGSSANVETSQSRPLYYAMHPTNPYDIRLYPTPNESFTVTGESNPYAPQVNTPSCIVDFYREPDATNLIPVISIPPYILRRVQKAYVLEKAFAAEGKGQDLKASVFYGQKYQFLIDKFRSINDGCFVGKKYAIEDGSMSIDGWRYPRPILPSNFESVRF